MINNKINEKYWLFGEELSQENEWLLPDKKNFFPTRKDSTSEFYQSDRILQRFSFYRVDRKRYLFVSSSSNEMTTKQQWKIQHEISIRFIYMVASFIADFIHIENIQLDSCLFHTCTNIHRPRHNENETKMNYHDRDCGIDKLNEPPRSYLRYLCVVDQH